MKTAWYIPLLAPAASLAAVFLTHYLTLRRESKAFSRSSSDGREHYGQIAEYIAGLRHQRPSEKEVKILAGLFPEPQALRRRIELRVRGERFVLGAAAGGALLYLALYPWGSLGRTTADPAGVPAAPVHAGASGAASVKAPCPGLAVTAIREATNVTGSPMVVEIRYASGPDRAYVCSLPSGQAYYFGMKSNGNLSNAIALPATPQGSGFKAANGKTIYYVESNLLQVENG
ncbi:hypothetical protein OWR29_04050 [Actinoplanes sp. Pm04-4]|uniref:Uncharacterized protein n=1 Tax=Paractinoplanes pyxinae TaxID=2997416 RepID=A0ABT4ASE1_9ACTN|nr:hypothetical protein [Actinoplanes pyxinae]MCY1137159.1 hypothetical protein [Actinoplanes pyxinae]